MERSLLKELNKKTLDAYINKKRQAALKKMYWRNFFRPQYTTQLTWESLAGNAGAPVMADVVEYNANAPLKSRRVVQKASGDIPKTALKRQMDEKDMNDYNVMKAMAGGDADKAAILDLVFNDIDFCYDGVMARTEFLCMQALSTGKISLDKNNNQGKITETAVDFGIADGNRLDVATTWETASSADPISDIRKVVKTAKENGHAPSYMIMHENTFLLMAATQALKDAYSFYQGVAKNKIAVPSMENVNRMLAAERLPQIMLVDSSLRFEDAKHTLTNINPWSEGMITFLQDLTVGKLKHGPIAEESSSAVKKTAIMSKKDHCLITKWSNLDPFGEFTKGQANFFPTFNDVESIYLLDSTPAE